MMGFYLILLLPCGETWHVTPFSGDGYLLPSKSPFSLNRHSFFVFPVWTGFTVLILYSG